VLVRFLRRRPDWPLVTDYCEIYGVAYVTYVPF
jgi:hypothetical protein